MIFNNKHTSTLLQRGSILFALLEIATKGKTKRSLLQGKPLFGGGSNEIFHQVWLTA
jgi:hypothetical protein